MVGRTQIAEQLCRLIFDIFGKAKRIAALRDSDRAHLAGPIVDVLKKVMVDSPIMCEVQRSFRQRLLRSRTGDFSFKCIKLLLGTEVELIHQDGRILVRVGIVYRVIHPAARLALAVAANDCAAKFFRRESLGTRVASALFHGGGHPNPLNRAYFAKTGTSDHEAAGLGTFSDGFLLLGHDLKIARIASRGMPCGLFGTHPPRASPGGHAYPGVSIPSAFSAARIFGGGPILMGGAWPVSSTLFRLERIAGQPWRPPARMSSLSGRSCDCNSGSFTTW